MPYEIDETHDPTLESWVESANDPGTDFPIQNLPFFVAANHDDDDVPEDLERLGIEGGHRIWTRVGNEAVDLTAMARTGLLSYDHIGLKHFDNVTDQLELEGLSRVFDVREPHVRVRKRLIALLTGTDPTLRDSHELRAAIVRPMSALARPSCPYLFGNYTDFYASHFHATNVGSMFRPDNPLLPNYKHVPIAYHGRASSIVASGTEIVRPWGQQAPADGGPESRPTFAPSRMLDYELEVGVVIGRGNDLGEVIPIEEAEDHIFGLCLVNDWSARDIQKWEYQPLGPFLAKNFATTVSPYIVTMEALAPFRTPAYERPAGDPEPLAYLDSSRNRERGGVDITLEVHLSSEQMRKRGMGPVRLSRGSFKDMYWTIAQMVTHHASNGCNLQAGDLLASGTVSGATRGERGCLLELTWEGDPFANPAKIVPGTQRTAIELPTGERRTFLEDGDEVIIRGYCEREGFRRIGFGECRGVVRAARAP